MRCAIGVVLALLLSSQIGLAEQALSSTFCIAKVRDGVPTERDTNNVSRLFSESYTLPGMPRPIIFPRFRGDVWTIDENRALVPFGGEFPQSTIWDRIARDPETGRFVGVNNARGVFALDLGETQFKKLYGVHETALRHPYSVEFIPRFNGFVISDASGIYLLNRAGTLNPLPLISSSKITPFAVFDLPAFDAVLINIAGPAIMIRFDDGETVGPTALNPDDFARSVNVEIDGSIVVRTHRDQKTIRLSRTPSAPIAQGRSFVVEKSWIHAERTRIEARSIGKVIVNDANTGLAELGLSGPLPIALPFDPTQEKIDVMVDMPEYSALLIITNASAYMLQDNGRVIEIRGARDVGVSPFTHLATRVIPVRNETIFLGRNSINLLVDTRISGEAACD